MVYDVAQTFAVSAKFLTGISVVVLSLKVK